MDGDIYGELSALSAFDVEWDGLSWLWIGSGREGGFCGYIYIYIYLSVCLSVLKKR